MSGPVPASYLAPLSFDWTRLAAGIDYTQTAP
jgi:hypothetical protein